MSGARGLSEENLTREELRLLREGAAAVGITAGPGSSSSRAASRASSQGGRLMLDSGSLAALTHHFDRLMDEVTAQMDYLAEQVALAAEVQYDEASAMDDEVEAEYARYCALNDQMEELERDFDRIANLREIVADQRRQVDAVERDLERAAADGIPSSRHRDDKKHSSHSHSHSSKHHSSKHHSSSKKHHHSSSHK